MDLIIEGTKWLIKNFEYLYADKNLTLKVPEEWNHIWLSML